MLVMVRVEWSMLVRVKHASESGEQCCISAKMEAYDDQAAAASNQVFSASQGRSRAGHPAITNIDWLARSDKVTLSN